MVRAQAAWRGIGGLMAAVVLAVLAFGPAVDAYVCRDDAHPAVAAASQGAQSLDHLALASADRADHADGEEACVHGHCHHGVVFLSPVAAEPSAAKVTVQRPLLAWADIAPADAQFGLMRPPRA